MHRERGQPTISVGTDVVVVTKDGTPVVTADGLGTSRGGTTAVGKGLVVDVAVGAGTDVVEGDCEDGVVEPVVVEPVVVEPVVVDDGVVEAVVVDDAVVVADDVEGDGVETDEVGMKALVGVVPTMLPATEML